MAQTSDLVYLGKSNYVDASVLGSPDLTNAITHEQYNTQTSLWERSLYL